MMQFTDTAPNLPGLLNNANRPSSQADAEVRRPRRGIVAIGYDPAQGELGAAPCSEAGPHAGGLARLPEPYLKARAHLSEELTKREIEVAILFLDPALEDLEIAEKLLISQNTLNTHRKNLFGKLGVKTRMQACYRFIGCYPEYLALWFSYTQVEFQGGVARRLANVQN